MTTINDTIQSYIDAAPVVLFMKGTADFPQCGFSAQVVQILNECDIDFNDHNVLESDELRQGIKTFSQWPTIPQLYIKGEFIGGCDIVTELFQQEKLKELLA